MNKKQCESLAAAFASAGKRTYVPPRFDAVPVEKTFLMVTSMNISKEGGQSQEEDWKEDEEGDAGSFDF